MKFENSKLCETCIKSKVCKFCNERNNLDYDINDKVLFGVYDKDKTIPFRLELTCNEWESNSKVRTNGVF